MFQVFERDSTIEECLSSACGKSLSCESGQSTESKAGNETILFWKRFQTQKEISQKLVGF